MFPDLGENPYVGNAVTTQQHIPLLWPEPCDLGFPSVGCICPGVVTELTTEDMLVGITGPWIIWLQGCA